jgi:CTP synthase
MKKYIFVSGGVISGLGKGIASSSIGVLLKSYGLKITMIKADPYLNVDAGTMNPLEHGETFVLEDGFETDMDIGTYERFTGELFSRANSMTCGAVFEKVIKDERSLAYEGKWVSIDYHVPQGMVDWIEKVSSDTKAEVTIIEIGGTVGEFGNKLFLEANRIMKVNSPDDVIHIQETLVK